MCQLLFLYRGFDICAEITRAAIRLLSPENNGGTVSNKRGSRKDRSSFLSWKSAFARNEQVRLLGSIKNLLEMYVRPNMTGSIRIKGVSKFVAQPHKCDHQVSNQPREETFVKTETRHEDREESERRFWSHIEPPRAIIELILV